MQIRISDVLDALLMDFPEPNEHGEVDATDVVSVLENYADGLTQEIEMEN